MHTNAFSFFFKFNLVTWLSDRSNQLLLELNIRLMLSIQFNFIALGSLYSSCFLPWALDFIAFVWLILKALKGLSVYASLVVHVSFFSLQFCFVCVTLTHFLAKVKKNSFATTMPIMWRSVFALAYIASKYLKVTAKSGQRNSALCVRITT